MDWVGVSDQQLAALLRQVRRLGIAPRIASRLMATDARVSDVEVSAALLTEGDQECIGFTIHLMASQRATLSGSLEHLRSAMERLTARIGRDPLPELMREAALLAQGHFVRIAMEQASQDAGAAANLLGVHPAEIHAVGAVAMRMGVSDTDSPAGVN